MSEQRRRGPMGGHGRGMRPTEKAKDFKGAMSKLFRYMSRYKMRFVLVLRLQELYLILLDRRFLVKQQLNFIQVLLQK